MSEYLVLMKLNPGKILDTLNALRNMPEKPIDGVDVCYSMNIFGSWDVGMWINAENSEQTLEFVQEKLKELSGVTEIYTVPTFPHRNTGKSKNEAKDSEHQKSTVKV